MRGVGGKRNDWTGLIFSTGPLHDPVSWYGIDHFTVVGLVTWLLNSSRAGVDLVLIQTSLLLLCKSNYSYANYSVVDIYMRKAERSVSKQAHLQPRLHSWPGN